MSLLRRTRSCDVESKKKQGEGGGRRIPPLPEASSSSGFNLYCGLNGSKGSFASSITFTDIGTECDSSYLDDPLLDHASAFVDEGAALDRRPGMPQRRVSEGTGLKAFQNIHSHDDDGELDFDVTPCRPTRKASATGSALALGDNHNDKSANRLESTPALSRIARPPLRPNRMLSCSTLATSTHTHQPPQQPCDDARQAAAAPSATATSSELSTASQTEPDCALLFDESIVERKLEQLQQQAAVFQSIVQVQDRKHGLKSYKHCFVGSEAVDQMLQAGLATTRENAVLLGQQLERYLGLFHHVCHDHTFQDKYLFYRFSRRQSDESILTIVASNSTLDMPQLQGQAFRFLSVVDLADRKYGRKTYKQCFIGSEAVTKMVEAGLATSREEAVELGKQWQQHLGLFEHVCQEHVFKDQYLFYRFCTNDGNNNNHNQQQLHSEIHSNRGSFLAAMGRMSSSKQRSWLASSVRSRDTIAEVDEEYQQHSGGEDDADLMTPF